MGGLKPFTPIWRGEVWAFNLPVICSWRGGDGMILFKAVFTPTKRSDPCKRQRRLCIAPAAEFLLSSVTPAAHPLFQTNNRYHLPTSPMSCMDVRSRPHQGVKLKKPWLATVRRQDELQGQASTASIFTRPMAT